MAGSSSSQPPGPLVASPSGGASRGIAIRVAEYAKVLEVNASTVYRWIRTGTELPPPATGLHRGAQVRVVVDPIAWAAMKEDRR